MPYQYSIDVRILVGGAPLYEYNDPEYPDGSADRALSRYVAVKAGQWFTVRIDLLPGFAFGLATEWSVCLSIDNLTHVVSKIEADHLIHDGILREPLSLVFPGVVDKDEATGRFHAYHPVFGEFDHNNCEDATVSAEWRRFWIGFAGTIRVGIVQTTEIPVEPPVLGLFPKVIMELPEGMLRNAVKYAQGIEVEAPLAVDRAQTSVDNYNSRDRQYDFCFKYRNKREYSPYLSWARLGADRTGSEFLQSIGCIPRTPSPPPGAALPPTQTWMGAGLSRRRPITQEV
ncbi:hypothetical protein A1O3_03498 [Capronia epimyces CBS 606.96]|uniref:DUF7918 domain-containing protein n=1 Tax=Capronia epimyces CBS 606.96 TaxID=1182542 RepID=W9YA70_9EURO|nr:uncharacterized protein A1O3_03498 [Capronia epimyces CBS 606.96]EXJ86545.1 hypothetical protein A1O3_03498 [Capronia epimyces CBS 606.96]